MRNDSISFQSTWKRTLVASAVAGALSIAATAATAGECPADKRVADGQGQKMSTAAAKGVTDVVRGSIDLAREPAAISGRLLRIRQLDIQPGGVVPWHSHGNRPAMIYIVSGEVIEYASNCAAPIVHKAGEIRPETSGTSHWWKNLGDKTVVLYIADVLHDKTEKNM